MSAKNKLETFHDAHKGAMIADALAMPVHWYYDRDQLDNDYGPIDEFKAPKNPHPSSILWRSNYHALNSKGDILHDHKKFWGISDVHYHQDLRAGENTLNFKLAAALYQLICHRGSYCPEAWLDCYIEFMLDPQKQVDTYVEEYHRGFFTNYSAGKKPLKCGIKDQHIGGLAQVPALLAGIFQAAENRGESVDLPNLRMMVKQHVALTHRNSNVLRAADCLTRMLWSLSEGERLDQVIKREAGDWFSSKKAQRWLEQPDRHVIGSRFSPACYIDQAFPASIYLTLKYANDFTAGVRANAEVGGDNCHRGAVVGALLGMLDPSGVTQWREKRESLCG